MGGGRLPGYLHLHVQCRKGGLSCIKCTLCFIIIVLSIIYCWINLEWITNGTLIFEYPVFVLFCINSLVFLCIFFEVKLLIFLFCLPQLPNDPVCTSVGWLVLGWFVGRSLCHNFLKGWEGALPCSYRSTYFGN